MNKLKLVFDLKSLSSNLIMQVLFSAADIFRCPSSSSMIFGLKSWILMRAKDKVKMEHNKKKTQFAFALLVLFRAISIREEN